MSELNNADKPAIGSGWPFLHDIDSKTNHGLTKREQFAAMAMQGLISDYERISDYFKSEVIMKVGIAESIANQSINYADALLKALEATK